MNSSCKESLSVNWYAVYTKPRWEKEVYSQLRQKNIPSFLPLVKTLKKWSDRRKWVEEPLFKSYLFVQIPLRKYYEVLNTNGIVYFVRFSDGPAVIPECQIKAVKRYILDCDCHEAYNSDNIVKGDNVEVIKGTLMGLHGHLVEFKGKYKVLIEIEAINESIVINIPRAHLRKL